MYIGLRKADKSALFLCPSPFLSLHFPFRLSLMYTLSLQPFICCHLFFLWSSHWFFFHFEESDRDRERVHHHSVANSYFTVQSQQRSAWLWLCMCTVFKWLCPVCVCIPATSYSSWHIQPVSPTLYILIPFFLNTLFWLSSTRGHDILSPFCQSHIVDACCFALSHQPGPVWNTTFYTHFDCFPTEHSVLWQSDQDLMKTQSVSTKVVGIQQTNQSKRG